MRAPDQGSMRVDEVAHLSVFEGAVGDWWAECLLCDGWVSTSNAIRRDTEQKFGRHILVEPRASNPTRS